MRVINHLGRVLSFVVFFAWEFLRANGEVLWDIVRPRSQVAPALVALPLRARTRLEIVSMTNLITLTPGTLTVEVAEDPPTLYVHGMFAGDPDRFIESLQALEDKLLAALRPDHPSGKELP